MRENDFGETVSHYDCSVNRFRQRGSKRVAPSVPVNPYDLSQVAEARWWKPERVVSPEDVDIYNPEAVAAALRARRILRGQEE